MLEYNILRDIFPHFCAREQVSLPRPQEGHSPLSVKRNGGGSQAKMLGLLRWAARQSIAMREMISDGQALLEEALNVSLDRENAHVERRKPRLVRTTAFSQKHRVFGT